MGKVIVGVRSPFLGPTHTILSLCSIRKWIPISSRDVQEVSMGEKGVVGLKTASAHGPKYFMQWITDVFFLGTFCFWASHSYGHSAVSV